MRLIIILEYVCLAPSKLSQKNILNRTQSQMAIKTFKGKLILALIVSALIPMTIISAFSIIKSSKLLEDEAHNKLALAAQSKATHVKDYLRMIKSQVVTMSSSNYTLQAALEFKSAISALKSEHKLLTKIS